MKTGTRETLAFVEASLPGGKVLEVGCGEGELAAALMSRRYGVTAIDSDPAAVGKARTSGVDAHLATWPGFVAGDADAVLFTRSLHHIADLDAAIARATECGPLLIVEDFAFPEADPRLIEWIRGELAALGVPWDEAAHEIHSFAAMRDAIARRYDIIFMDEVPYCYRYAPDEHAARLIAGERALGTSLLGRRVVGKRKAARASGLDRDRW